jgi:hypothetical protein
MDGQINGRINEWMDDFIWCESATMRKKLTGSPRERGERIQVSDDRRKRGSAGRTGRSASLNLFAENDT